MNEIVDRYLQTWNAPDTELEAHVAAHWSPTCVYVDPLVDVTGPDAVAYTVRAVRSQFPGFTFSRVGEVDAHHQQVRFRWGLGPVGEQPAVIGFDVVVVDDDGLIQDVRGFLDQVPGPV